MYTDSIRTLSANINWVCRRFINRENCDPLLSLSFLIQWEYKCKISRQCTYIGFILQCQVCKYLLNLHPKKQLQKAKKEILVEFVIGCQQCDPYSTSIYCSFVLNKTQSTDILYDYWWHKKQKFICIPLLSVNELTEVYGCKYREKVNIF